MPWRPLPQLLFFRESFSSTPLVLIELFVDLDPTGGPRWPPRLVAASSRPRLWRKVRERPDFATIEYRGASMLAYGYERQRLVWGSEDARLTA